MSKFRNVLSSLAFVGLTTLSAHAQLLSSDITTTPQAGQTYVSLGGTSEADSIGCYVPTAFCVNARGININTIARAPDVNAQFGVVNNQLSSFAAQFNTFSTLQTGTNEKLFDLVAISAALKDAVPNDGDRFAVRVNLGGFQNNLAGGISGAAKINDSMRFSAGVGHGSRQYLFNAGLNFSFN